MRNAVEVQNSLAVTKGISPYLALTKAKPNLGNSCIFGCLGMVQVLAGTRKNLDLNYIPCVYLYALNGSNYRTIDPQTQRVILARVVMLTENKFPLRAGK
jgi:hypothetical protein